MSLGAVLVTGGAGYIGSHVCKALAADGFEPVAPRHSGIETIISTAVRFFA